MSRAAPTKDVHPTNEVRVVVHGDDFSFVGTETELKNMELKMHEWYDVKVRGVLGRERKDSLDMEILGRTLRRMSDGSEEADEKHIDKRCGHDLSQRRVKGSAVAKVIHTKMATPRHRSWKILTKDDESDSGNASNEKCRRVEH